MELDLGLGPAWCNQCWLVHQLATNLTLATEETGQHRQTTDIQQQEVLQLLAEGRVMKEIGSILQMTTRTVAYHKHRIMEVIGQTAPTW